MAGANWDIFAVNESGQPSNGKFTSHSGVCVEIYKYWIYLSDDVAWREWSMDHGFIRPIIMRIDHGHVIYQDVEIWAARGPADKDLIYVAVSERDRILGMAGIGCYAYADDGTWIGVTQEDKAALREFLAQDDIPATFARAI